MAGICGEVEMIWEALLLDRTLVYDIGNIIFILFVLYSLGYLPTSRGPIDHLVSPLPLIILRLLHRLNLQRRQHRSSMNQVQTLQFSTIRLKHPQTQTQIVGTPVVENTLGNREARLGTNIVHILGVLVPIDIKLGTVSGRRRGVPEVKV